MSHRTPALAPPTAEAIGIWAQRLLGELGRAPETIYLVRQTLVALAQLPAQIEELIAALDRTTAMLHQSLPEVEARLEELGTTFTGVDGRLGNLEGTVHTLTSAITNLIGAIPGARRTLRRIE